MTVSTNHHAQEPLAATRRSLGDLKAPSGRLRILIWVVAGACLLAVPYIISSSYTMRLINLALVFSIYALSLNLVLGYTGLINLGQSAFLGIGAYATGATSTQFGLPFWACVAISIMFGAVAGVIVGVPSLRIGGHYLALVTVGFTQIAYVFFINLRSITGGYDGLGGIPNPSFFGVALDNMFLFYYLPLVLLLGVAFAMTMLRRSHIGRSMLGIREDEAMARALGVRAVRIKAYAFIGCSCIASFAGSLYAYLFGYVSPDSFTISNSVLILAMVLVGGIGSIPGVIAGAFVLTLLPEYLRFLGDWYPVVYASVIILVMISFPGGLAALVSSLSARIIKRRS